MVADVSMSRTNVFLGNEKRMQFHAVLTTTTWNCTFNSLQVRRALLIIMLKCISKFFCFGKRSLQSGIGSRLQALRHTAVLTDLQVQTASSTTPSERQTEYRRFRIPYILGPSTFPLSHFSAATLTRRVLPINLAARGQL